MDETKALLKLLLKSQGIDIAKELKKLQEDCNDEEEEEGKGEDSWSITEGDNTSLETWKQHCRLNVNGDKKL